MFLKNLRLKNFKNFRELEIVFHPKMNVIHGENAQGKTNLIEAIYYLSTLALFRPIDINELILENEKEAEINGIVNLNAVEKNFNIEIYENKKIQKINGKIITNTKEYFGDLLAIAYTPANINLIDGSPSNRRKYFDRSIFNHSVSFIDTARKYNKVVLQRNIALQQNHPSSSVDLFTEILLKEAETYIYERLKLMVLINDKIQETYERLFRDLKEIIQIKYNFGKNEFKEVLERDQIKNLLEQEMKNCFRQEFYKKTTSFGPHLHDFIFLMNRKSLKGYASQGQKKNFLLALKIAEMDLLSDKKPIFLIDDFTSELDEGRRQALFSYIKDSSNQTFITTTDINYLPRSINFGYNKYKVAKGMLV